MSAEPRRVMRTFKGRVEKMDGTRKPGLLSVMIRFDEPRLGEEPGSWLHSRAHFDHIDMTEEEARGYVPNDPIEVTVTFAFPVKP